ncbi:hypothetical protein B5M09_006925 [Aphanomyces astaci]|uniref:Cytochrome b5 heme-binding domain-containing protein n=1 Tax=Aphanomyces astaci TaxID=112090 RepID=A0A3R7WMC7_APHAT|nr:hypothetical protein B5M09_006925 [Aphanomyces astaci]
MTGGHGVRRNISREEIAQHNTEHDCWTILDGKVYNLTPYLRYHPGGVGKLMLSAGGDCTTLFNESHAWVNGHGMLEVQWYMCLYPTFFILKSSFVWSWHAEMLLGDGRVHPEHRRVVGKGLDGGAQLRGVSFVATSLCPRCKRHDQTISVRVTSRKDPRTCTHIYIYIYYQVIARWYIYIYIPSNYHLIIIFVSNLM